jgi:hypothetical protein
MSDIADGLVAVDPEKLELRKRVFDLERKLLITGDLKTQLDAERKRSELLEREFRMSERLGVSGQPKWTTAVPKSKVGHHVTPVFLLSDLHLDEVVRVEEMRGINAYSRAIAEMRLARLAENFVKVCRDHWTGLIYDGLILPLGGDIFSGVIHDELKETNEDTIIGSLYHWIDPIAQVISLMADEFGKVHVPVVVGNHGRTSRKPRAKFRARANYDWALGHALARTFDGDKRITFDIPDSADCRFEVYGSNLLLTHGDQASGGSGIGGIWPPIMRLTARKRAQGDAVGLPFDFMLCGHWHSLVYGPDFIVNGSMKGYDEYAAISNFSYEPPQQAAWLMSPEHGRTWTAPIFCADRKAEGW